MYKMLVLTDFDTKKKIAIPAKSEYTIQDMGEYRLISSPFMDRKYEVMENFSELVILHEDAVNFEQVLPKELMNQNMILAKLSHGKAAEVDNE